jgi:hypothetical protein
LTLRSEVKVIGGLWWYATHYLTCHDHIHYTLKWHLPIEWTITGILKFYHVLQQRKIYCFPLISSCSHSSKCMTITFFFICFQLGSYLACKIMQQVNKSFLLHLTFHAIKFNSKTITDIENIHEYYMKPLWQSIQRKNPAWKVRCKRKLLFTCCGRIIVSTAKPFITIKCKVDQIIARILQ